MGVASSPLWGPSSCILSTTVVFMLVLESDVPYLQYGQYFGELLLLTSKIQSVHPFLHFQIHSEGIFTILGALFSFMETV